MMEGKNKQSGRPQVYDGQMSDLAKRMENRRGTTGKSARRERPASPEMRKREQDNIMKMRGLGIVLGVLIVILIGALIYEVALGHGTVKTKNERAAEQQRVEQKAAPEPEKEITFALGCEGETVLRI